MALTLGFVDRPGGRKHHAEATPVIGGPAIVLSCAVWAIALGRTNWEMLLLGSAALTILVVGLLDDRFDIPWPYRLIAQTVAALILVSAPSLQITSIGAMFGNAPVHLGWLAIPVSVIAVVGGMNAINMCDGVDGLAGMVGATVLAMLFGAAFYSGHIHLAWDLAILLGGLTGFLLFNLRFPWQRRARVFLGNSGSAVLGLVLVWAMFRLTQTPKHPVAPVLAPFLVAPPLIDCLVLIVRRLQQGRSPFAADRTHLHHILLRAGWSPTWIALGVSAATAAVGLLAAALVHAHVPGAVLALAFAAILAAYYLVVTNEERLSRWIATSAAASPAPEGSAIPSLSQTLWAEDAFVRRPYALAESSAFPTPALQMPGDYPFEVEHAFGAASSVEQAEPQLRPFGLRQRIPDQGWPLQ